MAAWRRLGSERVARCRVFDVDRVRYALPDGRAPRDYFVVRAPDWINVVPLTDDGRVVLIRQFRVGIDSETLEIPGGMCDPGESPAEAAARELLEETGHAAREILDLGWVHPNPAIQSNRCHTFLAAGVAPAAEARPDGDEVIEVTTVPLETIPALIADGRITHALVIAAFHRLSLARPGGR